MGILVAECGFRGLSGVRGREEARGQQPGPAGRGRGPGRHPGLPSLRESQLPLPVAPGRQPAGAQHVTQAWKGPSARRGRAGSQSRAWPDTQGRPHGSACPSVSDLAGLRPPSVSGALCSGVLSGVSRAPPGQAVLTCPFAHTRRLGRPLPAGPVLQDRPAVLLGCLISLVFSPRERALPLFFVDLTRVPRS